MIPRFARKRSSTPASLATPPPPEPTEPRGMPQRALVPRLDDACGPATEILFRQLTPVDVAQVQERLEGDHRGMWDFATPEQRKRLALAFGLHYGVSGVQERTGLSAAEPPDEVHSVVRGMVGETGGSYYFADLVLECLDTVGRPLVPGNHALDFGCSSARVVRPLAAARADVHWHGCDPNAGAIAWAREHVPGVDFFVSDTAPPLPFADGSLDLDLAFAISVWSHYSAAAAVRWFEELHRLIRSGGHLLFTTHGLQSCVWFTHNRDLAIEAKLGEGWITDTSRRLERDGHCFWDVFGPHGDWGVVDSDWGLAFFTPEWLLENVTPSWALQIYRIGRAIGNQDVYLLERK